MSALSALIRRVDEDRWLASRFAPAAGRAKLMALYALNHEIAHAAEAAREPGLGAIRLQWWREALGEIAAGAPARAHPALTALQAHAPSMAAPLRALVDAREADLDAAPFPDWAALERYVDATAGLLMAQGVAACGGSVASDAQRAFVRDAGRAWGFTGLMRAAAHWQLRGRTLLPGGARMEELRVRAKAAHAAAQKGVRALRADAFPAFGYVALVPGYLRALGAGRIDTPLLARQVTLVWASATGRV